MKILALFALLLVGCSKPPVESPKPMTSLIEKDETSKWSYPYAASPEKKKKMEDGLKVLFAKKGGASIGEFIELLGEPDLVSDLRKAFSGLSPNEDGMLVQNRQYFSFRAVWYLKKQDPNSPNLNDIWFAAYIGNDENKVLKILQHHME